MVDEYEVAFRIKTEPGPFTIHDTATVCGVFCYRETTFIDGKFASQVCIAGDPWPLTAAEAVQNETPVDAGMRVLGGPIGLVLDMETGAQTVIPCQFGEDESR